MKRASQELYFVSVPTMKNNAQEQINLDEFWLHVGDTVEHVKEIGVRGKVVQIDANLIPRGVTTCQVLWDDAKDGETDIQWTNKLYKIV